MQSDQYLCAISLPKFGLSVLYFDSRHLQINNNVLISSASVNDVSIIFGKPEVHPIIFQWWNSFYLL